MRTVLTIARIGLLARSLVMLCLVASAAPSQSSVVSWGVVGGDNSWLDSDVAVAAGQYHTIVIRNDGTARAWSYCSQLPALPTGLTYVQVSGGLNTSFAVRSDGSVVCDTYSTAHGFPIASIPPLPAGVTYVQVSAGDHHVLARRSDGSVIAWGDNTYGQCNVPALPVGVTYFDVAANWSASLACRSDGAVVAFGYNGNGQGNVPALPVGLRYMQVSANTSLFSGQSAALRSDGSVVAWGDNSSGQCNVPALPVGLTYVSVAVGGYHMLGLRSDGSVVAWGANYEQQCNVPALPAGTTYVAVAAGARHSVALQSDGVVALWGDTSVGQSNLPPLPAGLTYESIAAGGAHLTARRSNGSVLAWGDNSSGQCNVPPLSGGLTYRQVVTGEKHTLFLRSDGAVIPTPPNGVTGYVKLFAGGLNSAGLLGNGTLNVWGTNAQGQCNVLALPAGLTYVDVAVGGTGSTSTPSGVQGHTTALRSDGSVVAWGSNSNGQCNVLPLPPDLNYLEVAAGGYHTVARRSDGSVIAWGDNSSGQCNVPPLPSGVVYIEVAAGLRHTVALRSNGSIVAWGDNAGGQCDVPPPSAGLVYVEVAASGDHTVARLADGLTPIVYCTSGTTSIGCNAVIAWTGQPSSTAATPFTLTLAAVPGQKASMFFYGTAGPMASPWGTGSSFSCVKTPRQRTGSQNCGGTFGACNGSLTLDWNAYVASHPNALGVPFIAGNSVWAQGWFRDPSAPKGSNLSNALMFTLGQ